jgi:Dynamin family
MHSPDRRAALEQALAELSALATGADRERLAELAERLRGGRLRVLVAGEAKRGKSTVANALLGRDVLPSGVTPVTAITTTVVYGEDEHVAVDFADGRAERRPPADLVDLVTERGNPLNWLGVARVTVHLDAPLLARGVEIVDTPGTGSIYEHNSEEAQRALETLDAAVVVLTADPPASAAERQLLSTITARSVMTFVLLNKVDRLDGDERAEALAFTTDVVRAATRPGGGEVPVYAVAARAALTGGRDEGFQAFTASFLAYLDSKRAADLEQAVTGHACRAAQRLLDEVRLAQRMSQMRTGEAAHRVELFRDRLAAVAIRRQDATDLAAGEQRRLLSTLNEAAQEEGVRLAADVCSELISFLDRDLAGANPGEIERRGREWLVARARDGAEAWRDQQRKRLEEGMTELDKRLLAALQREVSEVRGAARELLDLDLAMPDTGERLVPERRFFYSGAQISGQTELLAGAVRRRLPGQFGRHRAREHLRGEISGLVPMMVGRARSDLQYRLEESGRRLMRAVDARYADSIGRLVAVVDSAVAESGQADLDEKARFIELANREEALRVLIARLGGVLGRTC